MKRSVLVCALVGVLVGCASTPEEQKPAETVDIKPSVSQPTQPSKPSTDPRAGVSKPQTVGGDPLAALKDPSNILSRRSIYFDYDQFTVKEEFKPVVSAHARFLSQQRSMRVTVQGNTDERGSREYNLALGQRRADAVKQMMTLLGAPAGQIETISFGEEKPRTQGSTEQAWAENRRADIVYQGE
ncbi:MAG TPA: peptidoglycan-associated lipoprotein Pal [Burkholderiales bacterium]|nr:peptidoglycan-associated lipoprotein Pal [Burkholderiales bacterium]